jgi:hypothetical protein
VNADQQHFTEDVGVLFEQSGLPRMSGRILGWLLICDPPYQTSDQLAEGLQASKGSISTMTRLLMQIGLIEKIGLPGQRRDYFRIKPDAWSRLTKQRLGQLAVFRQLAERGLVVMEGQPPALRRRLQEMRDLYAFFEQELPAVVDRWEQQRKRDAS